MAAIPEFWPKRVGAERPQLVIQFAERFEDGTFGPPNLPISIPWPKPDEVAQPIDSSPVGPYQKGNFWATLTLIDNSKITINAATLELAEDLVREAALFVDPSLLPTPLEPKSGKRGGNPVTQRVVFPKIARYFPNGQKNVYPEWEVYF
ncbi:MAG: hypothetical protein HC924_15965 [Synechococcaceae cyanobacterium SM2_3_2]|nr:hypothetical protein [Synechococcaceae cyanobacterium SM2_3_2]